MPHGDLSDAGAAFCFATGTATLVRPGLWFSGLFFDVPSPAAEAVAAVRCVGGLLLALFPIFFVVRWNTVNGKAGALGCMIAAATFGATGAAHGPGFYAFAAAFVVEALHLAFNANPMLTSAMLLEKERAKAAKAN